MWWPDALEAVNKALSLAPNDPNYESNAVINDPFSCLNAVSGIPDMRKLHFPFTLSRTHSGISISFHNHGMHQVQVMNTLGVVLVEKKADAGNQVEMNLKEQGVYILRVLTEGNIYRKKVLHSF